jgi:hypothetical protein
MKLNIAVANIWLIASSCHVEGFQIGSPGRPAFTKRNSIRPNLHLPSHRNTCGFVAPTSTSRQRVSSFTRKSNQEGTHLRMAGADNDSNDVDEKSIEELYKIAMKEDEEWYNTFVRDVLGEDTSLPHVTEESTPSPSSSTSERNGANDNLIESDEPRWKVKEDELEQAKAGKEGINGSPLKRDHDENINGSAKGTREPNEQRMRSEAKTGSDLKDEIDPDDNTDADELNKISPTTIENEQASTETTIPESDDDRTLVQYIDMYDNVQRVPMSILSKLGYEMKDVIKLQAGVLELIIEDEMPLPRDGVPRRWMVDGRDKREVKILKKRREEPGDRNKDRDTPKRRNSSTERSTRAPSRAGRGDRNERRSKSSDNRRRQDPRARRSSRARQEGKRTSARSRRGDGKSSSLWMDIPTFKQYLRREADLRLTILGPDWEDWVKGESDWRLNLYKNWLEVVENGVGDDMFEDLSYAPPSERQRDLPVPSRSGKKRSSRPSSRRNQRGMDSQSKPRRMRTTSNRRDERSRDRNDVDSPSRRRDADRGRPKRRQRIPDDDFERAGNGRSRSRESSDGDASYNVDLDLKNERMRRRPRRRSEMDREIEGEENSFGSRQRMTNRPEYANNEGDLWRNSREESSDYDQNDDYEFDEDAEKKILLETTDRRRPRRESRRRE